MTTFYSEHNLRTHFSAPQFTRLRHRFRGPRESEKVNLEINQLYYSIHKLSNRHSDFQDHFVERAKILLEGGVIEGVENDDATPSPVELLGLENLVRRIDTLQRRVKALEA